MDRFDYVNTLLEEYFGRDNVYGNTDFKRGWFLARQQVREIMKNAATVLPPNATSKTPVDKATAAT